VNEGAPLREALAQRESEEDLEAEGSGEVEPVELATEAEGEGVVEADVEALRVARGLRLREEQRLPDGSALAEGGAAVALTAEDGVAAPPPEEGDAEPLVSPLRDAEGEPPPPAEEDAPRDAVALPTEGEGESVVEAQADAEREPCSDAEGAPLGEGLPLRAGDTEGSPEALGGAVCEPQGEGGAEGAEEGEARLVALLTGERELEGLPERELPEGEGGAEADPVTEGESAPLGVLEDDTVPLRAVDREVKGEVECEGGPLTERLTAAEALPGAVRVCEDDVDTEPLGVPSPTVAVAPGVKLGAPVREGAEGDAERDGARDTEGCAEGDAEGEPLWVREGTEDADSTRLVEVATRLGSGELVGSAGVAVGGAVGGAVPETAPGVKEGSGEGEGEAVPSRALEEGVTLRATLAVAARLAADVEEAEGQDEALREREEEAEVEALAPPRGLDEGDRDRAPQGVGCGEREVLTEPLALSLREKDAASDAEGALLAEWGAEGGAEGVAPSGGEPLAAGEGDGSWVSVAGAGVGEGSPEGEGAHVGDAAALRLNASLPLPRSVGVALAEARREAVPWGALGDALGEDVGGAMLPLGAPLALPVLQGEVEPRTVKEGDADEEGVGAEEAEEDCEAPLGVCGAEAVPPPTRSREEEGKGETDREEEGVELPLVPWGLPEGVGEGTPLVVGAPVTEGLPEALPVPLPVDDTDGVRPREPVGATLPLSAAAGEAVAPPPGEPETDTVAQPVLEGHPTVPLGVGDALADAPPLRVAEAVAEAHEDELPLPRGDADTHGEGEMVGFTEGSALRELLAGADTVAREREGGAEAHAVTDSERQGDKEGVPVREFVLVAAGVTLCEALPPLEEAVGTPGVPVCVGEPLATALGVAPAEGVRPEVADAGLEEDAVALPETAGVSVPAADTEGLSEGRAVAEAQRLTLTDAVPEAEARPLRVALPEGAAEGLSREREGVGEAPPGGEVVARAEAEAVKVADTDAGGDALLVVFAVQEVLHVG
jgi:hypothetical protein